MLHGSKVKIKLDVLIPPETPYHTKRFLHGVNKNIFFRIFPNHHKVQAICYYQFTLYMVKLRNSECICRW